MHEAIQFTRENLDEVCSIFPFAEFSEYIAKNNQFPPTLFIDIGNTRFKEWDWIVKDIQGNFYPVKDEIFRETYEECEDSK